MYGKFSQQSAFDAITGPSSVANCGLTFVFDIRHPNWYIATKIRVIKNKYKCKTGFRGAETSTRIRAEALLAPN
jgi:hypothetical protein